MDSVWSLDASSGTTPPNFLWLLIWVMSSEDTTEVSFKSAIPVSSQEDSIANIFTLKVEFKKNVEIRQEFKLYENK